MASQVAVIKALVKALTQITTQTGANAVNTAMSAIGLPSYISLLNTFNQLYSSASTTKNFLSQYCGINLDNNDIGAITGSDAGGSKTKTAESIIPENTSAKELTESEYSSFTKNGLTVNILYDKYLDIDKQRLIAKKMYNWWIPEALDLIDESLGVNFYDGRASTNTINIGFNTNSPYLISCYMQPNSSGRPSNILININLNLLKISENDKNGIINITNNELLLTSLSGLTNNEVIYYYDNVYYFDEYLASTLTAMTLMANINYYYLLPNPIYFGLVNIVNGMDNGMHVLNENNNYKLDMYDIVNTGIGYYGYAFMRCLAKNYADQFEDVTDEGKFYRNETSNTTLTCSNGNDSVANFGNNVIINALDGDDTVASSGDFVTINVENGNDVVVNTGSNVTINSGVGKDIIYNEGKNVIINTNEDNDVISNTGANSTINCGSGNDTVLSALNTGNYILINGDTGDDFLGSNGHYVTINGGSGNDSIQNAGENSYNSILNGNSGNDTILNEGNNVTIIGGIDNDLITLTSYHHNNIINYNSGDGNDTIMGYNYRDTINITNGKYTTTTSGQDVIINIGNCSIKLIGAKDTTLNIKGSYGGSSNSTSSGSTSNLITLTDFDKSTYTATSTIKNIDASSRTKATKITGNSSANSIIGGSGADSLSGGSGADTLNGGKGNDTLTGGAGNDVFFYQSGQGADVITDYATGDKIKISGAKISKTSVSGSDVILTVGTGSIKIKNGKGKTLSIYNNSTSATSTVIGSSSNSTSNGSTTVTLKNSDKSPYTAASSVKNINASSRTTAIKISGNTKANSIIGGSGADSLSGGGGADTLNGGKGNDTLTGGAGNDLFDYSSGSGNDVIADFTSGDKIRITGEKISKTSVSGSDVILKVGSGSIRIKSGKDKELSIYNNSKSVIQTVIGGSSSSSSSKILTLTNSDKSPVTLESGIKTANASSRTSAIKITGNSLANSIKGGKGADTLTGGKGNDTLTGGSGKDVFVYSNGNGNDVITDYSYGDKLRITGSYSTLESGDDIVVKVGSGKITLKNADEDDLNIASRASSFMELDLDSILNVDSDSQVIGSDYNYNFDSTFNLTKQLNQTFVTNSNKKKNK